MISLLMLQRHSLLTLASTATALKVRLGIGLVLMILPQVHLRKPCYDFSFL